MQVPQQCSGTRPRHGKETDLAGKGLRLVPDGVAGIARDRSGENDSEGPGEVGGQTQCCSGCRLHQTSYSASPPNLSPENPERGDVADRGDPITLRVPGILCAPAFPGASPSAW